ncbi:MAG: ABC transporter [Actinobacteria bacterium]|nr:ABC transporter [Actinomycetota bacterium]
MRNIRWRAFGAALLAFALLAAACGDDGPGEGANDATVASNLVFGGPPECPTRPSCMIGLNEAGIEFADFKALDSGGPLTSTALEGGEIDVALLFSTNPLIAVNGWVLLDDDIGLNPVENITPVVRTDVVDALGADFVALIDGVSAQIDTAGLTELNRQQSVDGDDPAAIAARWLTEHGYETMAPAEGMGNDPIVVSSFNFGESEILAEVYAQAMEGAGYAVERKLNLGSREIVKPALESGEIDFVPEYAGTLANFLGVSPEGDTATVHEAISIAYGGLGISVLASAPAEDKNALVVTAEVAASYGIDSISDLAASAG